ncbi:MAG: hypothetical protein ACKVYV_03375 [Limisphaerales bacterium]
MSEINRLPQTGNAAVVEYQFAVSVADAASDPVPDYTSAHVLTLEANASTPLRAHSYLRVALVAGSLDVTVTTPPPPGGSTRLATAGQLFPVDGAPSVSEVSVQAGVGGAIIIVLCSDGPGGGTKSPPNKN